MRILVTGGHGLLAHALQKVAPVGVEVVLLGHGEFDLINPRQMDYQLAAVCPQIVVNTAAYNAVDQCEVHRDLAWSVNATGPFLLAERCALHQCRLVHYGTDYVFDGEKESPYVETDPPNPLNHYAASKLAGEQSVLRAHAHNLVLRTSWLFGDNGERSRSYVHSVLRQIRAGQPLKATTDQISAPTYAPDLARWTFTLLEKECTGLFHAVNDDGLSRHEWTLAIVAEAKRIGLLQSGFPVEAVHTDFFGPGICRPKYAVLSNAKVAAILGRPLGSWRPGLREMLGQMSPSEW